MSALSLIERFGLNPSRDTGSCCPPNRRLRLHVCPRRAHKNIRPLRSARKRIARPASRFASTTSTCAGIRIAFRVRTRSMPHRNQPALLRCPSGTKMRISAADTPPPSVDPPSSSRHRAVPAESVVFRLHQFFVDDRNLCKPASLALAVNPVANLLMKPVAKTARRFLPPTVVVTPRA